jgi:L-aspartate oxidase
VLNDDGLGIVHAPSVILATGGLGHLYTATTNPEGSTGDGVALAMWAGLPVSDLEFIQFHPTMLFDGDTGGRRPLITEAVRGEGAILIDREGNSVTAGVHPMGDLAPRDVVAAAIDTRLSLTGDPCVYLDARGIDGFKRRFPTVTAACRDAGIDPTRELDSGCAGSALQLRRRDHSTCTAAPNWRPVRGRESGPHRPHGANRLASNSLLEIWSWRAGG